MDMDMDMYGDGDGDGDDYDDYDPLGVTKEPLEMTAASPPHRHLDVATFASQNAFSDR